MKKPETNDLFNFARVIKASGMRKELSELIEKATKEKKINYNQVGINGFLLILEALAGKNAEEAIYIALANPFEMSAEEIAKLPIDEFFEKLTELVKLIDIKRFFGCVSASLGKK